jgi:hypothetical protein
MKPLRFEAGCHAEEKYTTDFLTPLFTNGTITQFAGADYYAVCYGELCAYEDIGQVGANRLLAVWSVGLPDCLDDVVPGCNYAGEWIVQ